MRADRRLACTLPRPEPGYRYKDQTGPLITTTARTRLSRAPVTSSRGARASMPEGEGFCQLQSRLGVRGGAEPRLRAIGWMPRPQAGVGCTGGKIIGLNLGQLGRCRWPIGEATRGTLGASRPLRTRPEPSWWGWLSPGYEQPAGSAQYASSPGFPPTSADDRGKIGCP